MQLIRCIVFQLCMERGVIGEKRRGHARGSSQGPQTCILALPPRRRFGIVREEKRRAHRTVAHSH